MDNVDVIYKWISLLLGLLKGHLKLVVIGFVFLALTSVFNLLMPVICRLVFDVAIPKTDYKLLLILGGAWIAILVVQSWCYYFSSVTLLRANSLAKQNLKGDTFNAVLNYIGMYALHEKEHQKYISHIVVDVESAMTKGGIQDLVTIVIQILSFILYACFAIYLNLYLGVTCLVFVFAVIIIQHTVPRKLQVVNEEVVKARGVATEIIENRLVCSRTIIRFCRCFQETKSILQKAGIQSDAEILAARVQQRAILLNGIISSIAPIALIWLGAYLMSISKVSMGTFISFFGLFNIIYMSVQSIYNIGLKFIAGASQATELIRMKKYNKAEVEKRIGELVDYKMECLVVRDVRIRVGKFEICCNRLEMHPGKTYLIRGDSGSGKTVFVEFLAGMRIPETANISINGRDAIDKKEFMHFARSFGYIEKDEKLFKPDVKYNAEYGNCIADTMPCISALGVRYDSRVSGLSSGECQRVSVVRELLRDAPVFIIDEGLDSLHLAMREKALSVIRSKLPNCILLIVSHHWQDIKDVDSYIDIQDGILVQS